jgi:hypothetical protein
VLPMGLPTGKTVSHSKTKPRLKRGFGKWSVRDSNS